MQDSTAKDYVDKFSQDYYIDIETKYKELLLDIKYRDKRLNHVLKVSDRQSLYLLKTNEELDEYKEKLEQKVEEKTSEITQLLSTFDKHVIASKTDTKGVITYASVAFCDISGYKEDELLGQPHNIVRHQDMPASAFEDLWSTLKLGQQWQGEVKNLKKDGGYYWVKAIVTPEYDIQNKLIGYSSIRQNITDKKKVEELSQTLEKKVEERTKELKKLNDTLEDKIKEEASKNIQKELQLFEQSKMANLGAMIGNIAHQWRQPLSAISTISSAIKIKEEHNILKENELSKSMDSIVEKTQYLSETITTFRNFLKEKKEFREVILQDRIKVAIKIVNTILEDKNIKLYTNIQEKNPIKIKMVIGELTEVIINILNNAKDVLIENEIDDPWIKLNLEIQKSLAIITIEDNAGGIPNHILSKIFDPYFTTKEDKQGTGLGLHMSHDIIHKSLKGNIYAKNTQYGAKFFVEVPLT